MRVNEDTVLRGCRVLLVPYEPHHVPRYHEWMKSEELQKLTASEPLTLEQEYDMQRSWREDNDKCTFIVLDRERWDQGCPEDQCMVGDVNLFVVDPENPSLAEIEIMIAGQTDASLPCTSQGMDQNLDFLRFLPRSVAYRIRHLMCVSSENYQKSEPTFRGRGFGEESARLMLYYGATNLGISTFQAKIGQENVTSVRLFNRLHFKEVSYSSVFQEMTLHWEVTETERQWLLDSVHVTAKSYREAEQNREANAHD